LFVQRDPAGEEKLPHEHQQKRRSQHRYLVFRGVCPFCVSAAESEEVVLSTSGLRYVIGPSGKNASFTDRRTGTTYVSPVQARRERAHVLVRGA
jgi:hypothetical protein